MSRYTFFIAVAAIVLNCMALSLAQGGTYRQFDYPGAMNTDALSINQARDIVGVYFDVEGSEHGFLLEGDVFTPLDYGSEFANTVARGINDLGQVVGYAMGSGFIYNIATSSFTPFEYPGVLNAQPTDINNTGSLVGLFQSGKDYVGFQCFGSECKQITPDGMSATMAGVTDAGAAFGMLDQPFRRAHGQYRRFKIPGEPSAEVFGVNFAGTALVGSLPDEGSRAFLYKPGSLTILEYPGSPNTQAYGVTSDGRTVVGAFVDADNIHSHGFI
nr:hypothetical protein [Terriglobales bacterium]